MSKGQHSLFVLFGGPENLTCTYLSGIWKMFNKIGTYLSLSQISTQKCVSFDLLYSTLMNIDVRKTILWWINIFEYFHTSIIKVSKFQMIWVCWFFPLGLCKVQRPTAYQHISSFSGIILQLYYFSEYPLGYFNQFSCMPAECQK